MTIQLNPLNGVQPVKRGFAIDVRTIGSAEWQQQQKNILVGGEQFNFS